MKVAISTAGNSLDANVDPRFGRCNHFIIINTSDMSYNVISNDAQYEGHGAGVSAAQKIIQQDIDAIISGNIGPNAFQVIRAANVKIYTFSGTVKDAINKLLDNQLIAQTRPTNTGHFGMGAGRGQGRGRGRN